MVFFEDHGTLINAPIEVVWEYWATEEHQRAHVGTLRHVQVEALSPWTSLVTAERSHKGRWSKFVTRSTVFAPVAIANEEIEGLFAGSKFIMLYSPHGRQTRVDVIGELQSPTFPEKEISREFEAALGASYDEDTPHVEAFAKRK
jgi:uncharacterized membrane protein